MRARATALIVLGACVLGGCGEDGPSEDEKQIRAVVTELLTTKDPGACTRLATQTFLEQTTFERGKAAIRDCRKSAGESSAQSVTISRVAVSGPRASADLRPKGGELPFNTLRVGLRKAAGRWKVDRAERATLNRSAFFRFTRKDLSSPPDKLASREVDCVLREFKSIEDEAIVRAVLDVDPRLFVVPGAVCGIRSAFSGSGVPERVVVCAQRRIRRELTSGVIGRRLAANPARASALLDSPGFARRGQRIVRSCVGG